MGPRSPGEVAPQLTGGGLSPVPPGWDARTMCFFVADVIAFMTDLDGRRSIAVARDTLVIPGTNSVREAEL